VPTNDRGIPLVLRIVGAAERAGVCCAAPSGSRSRCRWAPASCWPSEPGARGRRLPRVGRRGAVPALERVRCAGRCRAARRRGGRGLRRDRLQPPDPTGTHPQRV